MDAAVNNTVEKSSTSNMTREFSTLPSKCDKENGGPISPSAENQSAAEDSIMDDTHQCTVLPDINLTRSEKPCRTKSKRGIKMVGESYGMTKNKVSSGKFDSTGYITTCNEENDSRTVTISPSFNYPKKQNTNRANDNEGLICFTSPSFTEENGLKTHTINNKKPLSCPICSRSFTQTGNLRRHIMIIHYHERPFSCPTCGRSFTDNRGLKKHILVHDHERPYVSCSVCGRSFTTDFSLKRHIARTHNKEKPFSCSTCGRSYAEKRNLKIHTRKHNYEKPFSCAICSHSFSSKRDLNIHMMTHEDKKLISDN